MERLVEAARAELRDRGYEGLSVRGAARRAGVAPATAYNYFSSREHLIAEVFWRQVAAQPVPDRRRRRPPAQQAAAALSSVADLVAAEPELARACTLALLADDPDVRRLRDQIGREWARRVTSAVGDGVDPERVSLILLAWSGALLAAGMGHLRYADLPERMESVARLVLGDGR